MLAEPGKDVRGTGRRNFKETRMGNGRGGRCLTKEPLLVTDVKELDMKLTFVLHQPYWRLVEMGRDLLSMGQNVRHASRLSRDGGTPD